MQEVELHHKISTVQKVTKTAAFEEKLDIDARRDNDASPMSSYRCMQLTLYCLARQIRDAMPKF